MTGPGQQVRGAPGSGPRRHDAGSGSPLRRALLRPRLGLAVLVPAVALALAGGAVAGLGVRHAMAPGGPAPGVSADRSGDATARSAGRSAPPTSGGSATSASPASPTSTPSPTPTPVPTPVRDPADVLAGLLSHDTPAAASGTLTVVPGAAPAPLEGAPVRTVRVEVEDGLPVDGPAFAAFVLATLNDDRGWGHGGAMTFARTDADEADLRVVLASPAKVDELCAPLQTNGEYSCGRYGHAAINFTRWVTATPEFADLTQYRTYVVNHEVGHLLGHPHETCPGEGRLAPIMQQQSIAVAPCVANGWPHP